MKKYILFLAIFISLKGFSVDLDILITTVDNEGAVSGVTYRIYAKKYDKNVTINGVVGTFVSPVVVRSTTSFYQSTYGGYSSQFVDEGNYSMDSTLLYDSWFTLGYETNQNNSLISLGGYFSQFENGDSLYMNNGCWFVPQDDPASNSGDCVLIGQFYNYR
ncbi:MAG: hypothetical protein IPP69_04895 [Flavobacteriales bacterium]|nr:hypothetical protein [Flavobacteriales bacterium]